MSTTSTDYVRSLESITRETAAHLRTLPDSIIRWRPKAGAWSIKEIIGHLVDSAANNHQRFVRADSQGDLVFQGYAQDEWVRIQSYESAPWNELVSLWESYNLHIARVMAAVPARVRDRKHAQHLCCLAEWEDAVARRSAKRAADALGVHRSEPQ